MIRTVREPVGFSTGAVMTGDWGRPVLFQQAFGRFEARLRFPRQQGHWCAFWLENPDVGLVDGSGRDGTEIDVVEKAWLLDQVQHTLHWDGYAAAHRSAEQLVTGRGLSDGGWHVFRVDWYPGRVRLLRGRPRDVAHPRRGRLPEPELDPAHRRDRQLRHGPRGLGRRARSRTRRCRTSSASTTSGSGATSPRPRRAPPRSGPPPSRAARA